MQSPACRVQRATISMQHASYDRQRAACKMQHTPWSPQHTTDGVNPATRSPQHAACKHANKSCHTNMRRRCPCTATLEGSRETETAEGSSDAIATGRTGGNGTLAKTGAIEAGSRSDGRSGGVGTAAMRGAASAGPCCQPGGCCSTATGRAVGGTGTSTVRTAAGAGVARAATAPAGAGASSAGGGRTTVSGRAPRRGGGGLGSTTAADVTPT